MRIASSLLFASFVAVAQPRMSAPVAGYVFDGNTGSIRAVVGVPGAASAGDRLPLSDSLAAAFLHPSLQLAAGVGKDGAVIAVNWTDPSHPRQFAITPRLGPPDRIVFASTADKALLISAAGVELWSGLSAQSAVAVYSYTTDALGGVPRNAALSNDGAFAAVALDSAQVMETSESGVRAAGDGRSAIYAPLTGDLFILNADGVLSQVQGGSANVLAGGLESDTELAAMTGFNGVVAMSSQKGTLSLIDAASGQLTRVDCGGCKPTHAQTLLARGILYFEDAERGGLLLDSTNSGPPRIVPLAGIDGRRNQ